MTAYPAEAAQLTAGALVTKRTGTAAADTVPAGSTVLWINTGAGSHVITLTNSATQDGLAVANRTITVLNATAKSSFINASWGDANGLVAVGIDGTAAEVNYYVLAA